MTNAGFRTFSIHTFGCKVNQYEEEQLRRFLTSCGLDEREEAADVSFINTCTVTHLADRKARQKIRQLIAKGTDGSQPVSTLVIVIGCGARNPESFKGMEKKENILHLDNRDNNFYGNLKNIICAKKQKTENYTQDRTRENNGVRVDFSKKKIDSDPIITTHQKRTRAFVKIQDGCNHFCSYCIVPYVRSGLFSTPADKVLEEVVNLDRAGFKEIVITGVNLGLYGTDLAGGIDLCRLLEDICANTNIKRVRLSSIEPNYVTDELILLFKKYNQICPHFHIPIQHASDKILKLMNRQYAIKEYDALLRKITEAIQGCAVSTDILVGFPEEADDDFEFLYNYIKKAPFSRLHVFKYSERPFTKAKDFKGKVPESVKSERSRKLIKLADEKLKMYNDSFADKILDVLVEDNMHKSGYMQGYTPNYIQVLMQADSRLKNEIVPARLYKQDGMMFGRI